MHTLDIQDLDLVGKVLIAMPHVSDPIFSQSIILICSHNTGGSLGIVVNKPADSINFYQLMRYLNLSCTKEQRHLRVHFGGPMELSRGFVIHSNEFITNDSLCVHDGIVVSGTLDVLGAIAENKGPKNKIIALGYMSWTEGQLNREIRNNKWLQTQADSNLIFNTNAKDQWKSSLQAIGIDMNCLASLSGTS